MKSVHKYILLVVVVVFVLLLNSTRHHGSSNSDVALAAEEEQQTKVRSTPAIRKHQYPQPPGLDLDSYFDDGLFYGVASVQMELAMANHKLPPLRPVVLDANAPLPVIKRILIASTWRTGSSFVGDLIRSSPGAFYSFEPLHFVDADARIESIPALSRSLRLLQSLYQCRFPADYLRHINGQGDTKHLFMSTNSRVWQTCSKDRSLCTRPDFVSRLCSHFPVHVIKSVRLPVAAAGDLMERLADTDDGLRLVVLVRDPRGVMASRANLTWCRHPSCSRSDVLCHDVQRDLASYERLRRRHGADRVHLLKFEDLAADMSAETAKLYAFLGLNVTTPVQVFLKTHTELAKKDADDDPYSTQRLSKSVAAKWRRRLPAQEAAAIAANCTSVLQTLQYPLQ